VTEKALDTRSFSPTDAARVLPRRVPGAHKWSVGGLMIIAGAPGYVGAAALCAMAAGRSGAGVINLAVHRSLVPSISPLVPEASFTLLPDGELTTSSSRLMDAIEEKAARCAAFVIGPGLGEDDYARNLVATFLGIGGGRASHPVGFGVSGAAPAPGVAKSLLQFGKPVVVDADGLNALSRLDEWWANLPEQQLLLTPHVGELSRLLDTDAGAILADPSAAVIEAARRFRQTILLKGHPSLVSDGSALYSAGDAPLSLATAGSGDVLAGSIGAFLAQGLSLLDAANLGLFIGARAARGIEAEMGTVGLVASDLPRAIAAELGSLERA
jgi:NAD(P)H-hydrate repair Nnr-like enzyme with NAD(P)H-hydrate dehydratase domain